MIKQLSKKKCGYDISKSSVVEWRRFCKWFKESNDIYCIICNSVTAEKFKAAFEGMHVVIIRDKIPDNIVYINNVR